MRWLVLGVTALAALVGVVAVIGLRLPRAHSVSRRVQLAVPPEAVWRVITDIDAFPSWRSDVTAVTRLPDVDGRLRWVEETASGRIPLAVDQSEAPRLLVVRIDDPNLPFGGTWTYDLRPAPTGSSLTITEDGEVYNPIFRFMARFIFGYDATLITYVANLEKRMAMSSGGADHGI